MSSNLQTPLKGLAIGNGWIDGESQYPGYLEFALKHDLIKEGSEVSFERDYLHNYLSSYLV
jgi:carboxypeptidase D